MISSLTTVRLWSNQAALNAFKEESDSRASDSAAAGTAHRSLADVLFAGNDDRDDDSDLSGLITSLQRQAMIGGATAPDTTGEGSADDISSKAFMRTLQEKLEVLKKSPDTKTMAESMLAALKDGRLTVTDAVAGEQIEAWDINDKSQKPTEQKTVGKDDWTGFLKERLSRDSSGKYVRNDDSSHKEKMTGASGYFGMVGDRYYYLSWTASPAAVVTTEPAAGK